jgi:hypothetical protein
MRSLPAKPVTWIVALTLIVGLAGCLKIPLGNPEQSKVDGRYAGLWIERGGDADNGGTLVAVVPFDARTYAVTMMKFTRDADKRVAAEEEANFKMWLTDVRGTTFLTLEPKDPSTLLADPDQKFYVVAKLSRDDQAATIAVVSSQFVEHNSVTTPTELEKLIADNLANPDLFADSKSYDLLGPDRADEAKTILAAFNRRNAK